MELQVLRQKAQYDNEHIKNRMNEMRDTMARKGRMTRLSMLQADFNASGELSDDLEKKYLQILYKDVIPTLNDLEADALKALAS
jgi:hypothetical protein